MLIAHGTKTMTTCTWVVVFYVYISKIYEIDVKNALYVFFVLHFNPIMSTSFVKRLVVSNIYLS